jgi:hypothetical protein
MARTTLTPILALGGYPTAGVTAVFTPADPVNLNQFLCTGKEVLLTLNTDTVAQTLTIHSVTDPYGRKGDIVAESIAPGAYHVFGPLTKAFWAQTNGFVNVDPSAATLSFVLIHLP